jgi:hypothetical protein
LMKLRYTCFSFLLLISLLSFSQPPKKNTTALRQNETQANNAQLTGVWRGFFTSGAGFFQEKYKYEVQIGQLSNNGIKGVTYSYKTTVFYGKASLAGMYTPSTKNLVLKETKLVEVKMAGGEACLMTCYLEYSKVGNIEVLEGTFTSVNVNNNNSDCGGGRVYLEKVAESDFYKEEFVKEHEKKKTTPPATVPRTDKTTVKTKPPVDPPVKTNIKKDTVRSTRPPLVKRDDKKTIKTDEIKPRTEDPKKPLPKELKERENKLAKIIQAEGDEIVIELYDNGQIDDDTITIYHNNQTVVWKKRLCHQPITLKIKVDPSKPRNEFIMVADNLGRIPPNTALMVITVGKQRHELFLTSTEQKNAMVIIECKLPSRDTR